MTQPFILGDKFFDEAADLIRRVVFRGLKVSVDLTHEYTDEARCSYRERVMRETLPADTTPVEYDDWAWDEDLIHWDGAS